MMNKVDCMRITVLEKTVPLKIAVSWQETYLSTASHPRGHFMVDWDLGLGDSTIRSL